MADAVVSQGGQGSVEAGGQPPADLNHPIRVGTLAGTRNPSSLGGGKCRLQGKEEAKRWGRGEARDLIPDGP